MKTEEVVSPPDHGWRESLLWFSVGVATAWFLLATQALSVGGWAGILQVGPNSSLRPLIESELGEVPISHLGGHDGHIYYAIGLNPSGSEVIPLLDHPGLRYRRILFPSVASLAGSIDGEPLLVSMLAVTSIGLGIGAASLRSLISSFGLPMWVMLGLLANPGIWFGVRILTPDPLAIGLGLLAIALLLTNRLGRAIVALTAAAFAKEPYLICALGAAGWLWTKGQRRGATMIALIPAATLGIWGLVVENLAGGGFSPTGNLALPGMGIIRSLTVWESVSRADLIMSILTVTFVLTGFLLPLITRWSFLAWMMIPWSLVAVITSEWVWRFGNASIRVFAILGVFGAIGVGRWLRLKGSVSASQVPYAAQILALSDARREMLRDRPPPR